MRPGPSDASLFQLAFQCRIRITEKKRQCMCSRTLVERRYGTRIRDEDVEPPNARKERLYRLLGARRLAHVHDQHEHLRAWYCFDDRALRLSERFFRAWGYCQRHAGPSVLQRDVLPDPTRLRL